MKPALGGFKEIFTFLTPSEATPRISGVIDSLSCTPQKQEGNYEMADILTFYRNLFTAGHFSTAPLQLGQKDDGLSADLTCIRYTYSFERTTNLINFILWIESNAVNKTPVNSNLWTPDA